MTTRRCIYGPAHGRQYENEQRFLAAATIPATSKDLIGRWSAHLFAKGTGKLRVGKLCSQLRRIAEELRVGLDVATREDAERLLARFNQSEKWTPTTKADYRRALKQFYSWYQEEDPRITARDATAERFYAYLDKHVNITAPLPEIDSGEVLSQEDIQEVIQKGTSSVKERAFLAVLHEGGFRAAEMLNMQRRDVEFLQDRVIVQVDGKTGRRKVPLVWSTGYLSAWLEHHPLKDRDAYIWITENQNPVLRHQPMKHGGAQKMVRRCFEKADCRKPSNLHHFRHSRASLNARWMSEAILCRYFGWTIGSRMVRRYVHLNVDQVEDAVLSMNGIKRPEDETPKPRLCSCGLANEPLARYCHRCGKPLGLDVITEDEPKKSAAIEEAMREYAAIMADPVRAAKFAAFLRDFERRDA